MVSRGVPTTRTRTRRRRLLSLVALLVAGPLMVGCSDPAPTRVVRGADDVQVMDPSEVNKGRMPPLVPDTTAPTGTGAATGPTDSVADTIPLNKDDRPPELRLFDAFGKFRGCLEGKGYKIEGDLLDPKNPAYQDPAYLDAVSTCAARTDIVNILKEVQATRSNLTPEQVEQRNQVFTDLRDCLEAKGWTVETTTSEIGLLEPKVFQNAAGVLDERDINQCLAEQKLGQG